MAVPWLVLDSVATPEGTLELRRRGTGDFLITLNSLVLMNSSAHRSEVALGRSACDHLRIHPAPRVLVAGLGMGYTLRAVLDVLPDTALVTVAELNPVVLEWCRGPLAVLTDAAVADPRVTVELTDVAQIIRRAASGGAEGFDAIVLDLFTGPHVRSHPVNDPLYGSTAIGRTRAALRPAGVFAVWGENPDAGFADRLRKAGFTVSTERPGRGGLRHVVYLARLTGSSGNNPPTRR